MLNLQTLREDPDRFKHLLEMRGIEHGKIEEILKLDESWRNITSKRQSLRAQQKEESKRFASSDVQNKPSLTKLRKLKDEIAELEQIEQELSSQLEKLLLEIPNLSESQPTSDSERNIERSTAETTAWGFQEIQNLVSLPYMPILKGAGVLLHRALEDYLFAQYIAEGYVPLILPLLMRPEVLVTSADLPVMKDYLLRCERDDLFLNYSIESVLSHLHSEEILTDDILPLRYVSSGFSFNPQFTSTSRHTRDKKPPQILGEFGTYIFSHPKDAKEQLFSAVQSLDEILNQLNVPYRSVTVSSGGLPFASELSYKHEVWFPSQQTYMQVALTSSYTDFQARRSATRFYVYDKKKRSTVFTYGVGQTIGIGMLLFAILENGQTIEGNVILPRSLAVHFGANDVNENVARINTSISSNGKVG